MADRRGKRSLERIGFRLLTGTVRALPRGGVSRVASGVGRFAFDVARVRRRVAVDNVLQRIAPAGGRAAAERIARESYVVTARTFLDLIRMDLIRDEELWRILDRKEFEHFLGIRDAGGAVLVSGHFGNWELLVLGIARMGVPVCAVAGDQANRFVDAEVKAARGRAGVETLSARSGLRGAVASLRRGECVATLMDQDARHKGVFVDFLGTPTSCHTGVVSLAMRTGKPLLPGVLVDQGGRYTLRTAEPWRPDPSRTEEENLRAGTTHFHRFLEEQVRSHPGNYLWAHRRWKTRPPEERG